MFKRLMKTFFNGQSEVSRGPDESINEHPNFRAVRPNAAAVHYPPQDPGLTCPSAKRMVDSQSEITSKLKLHAAVAPELYSERFATPIQNLAAIVANLPGSASGVFAGEGGMFRASLEMAFNCFRASDGRIFTGASTVEERHLLEGRWRYVCFAAGLLYPLGAPLQNMQVLNAKAQRWAPELDALVEWIHEGNQYWVTWFTEHSEPGPSALAGMLVHKVLGRKNIDWLNSGSPEMIRRLVEVATGSPAASSLIAASVIKDVWASIHQRETARLHQNYGRLVVGSHTSPYLIDSMVVLARDKWKINEKTLFVDAQGVYLEWPVAAHDIIEYCATRGYAGIPASESALLAMLMSSKLVASSIDGVAIEEIANQDGEIVGAVKLAKPGLLIDDMSSFQKPNTRPISLAAVVAADPIAAPSPEKTKPQAKTSKPATASTNEQRPTLDTLVIDENSEEIESPSTTLLKQTTLDSPTVNPALHTPAAASEANKPDAVQMPAAAPAKQAKQKNAPAPFVEGEVVNYTSQIPKDIADRLKPHSVEVLGKIIHAWKTKSHGGPVMRMTSSGAAIEQEFILGTSTRAVDAVLDWAGQGLLYIDPGRQGVKFHQIATVDGGQTKISCIVFSNGACKSLGIT
jgi:hypothetical protein